MHNLSLKRMQSNKDKEREREKDRASVKRQSFAVNAAADLDESSVSVPVRKYSARSTKAASLFSVDDLIASDAANSSSNSVSTSTPAPPAPTYPLPATPSTPRQVPSAFPASAAAKMTVRSAEPEYLSTRALSRFLRVTGPLEDEPPSPSSSSPLPPLPSKNSIDEFGVSGGRPRAPSASLGPSTRFSTSTQRTAGPAINTSSAEYFKALDARLDSVDRDVSAAASNGNTDSTPSSPKSIRKSRSIGESLSLRTRPRSYSTNVAIASSRAAMDGAPPSPTSMIGPGPSSASPRATILLPNSPPLPYNPNTHPLSQPPLLSQSLSASPREGNSRMKNFGEGLATILKRKKSASATSTHTNTPRKDSFPSMRKDRDGARKEKEREKGISGGAGGSGHNRQRAGIGSDDHFIPPSLINGSPNEGRSNSPFNFRKYASQSTDGSGPSGFNAHLPSLPPIFRTNSSNPPKISPTTPSSAQYASYSSPPFPLLADPSDENGTLTRSLAGLAADELDGARGSVSSALSFKHRRIPVKYDQHQSSSSSSPMSNSHSHHSFTSHHSSSGKGGNFPPPVSSSDMPPSLLRKSLASSAAYSYDYGGYDEDEEDEMEEGGVERISIDGDLGEFHPSPCTPTFPEAGTGAAGTPPYSAGASGLSSVLESTSAGTSATAASRSGTMDSSSTGVEPEDSTDADAAAEVDGEGSGGGSARSSVEEKEDALDGVEVGTAKIIRVPLVIETKKRPSTTSTTATATAKNSSSSSPLKFPISPPRGNSPTRKTSGAGSTTPPLSPPPSIPLPVLPGAISTLRPSLSLIGIAEADGASSRRLSSTGNSPTVTAVPTSSSQPSTATSLVSRRPSEQLTDVDVTGVLVTQQQHQRSASHDSGHSIHSTHGGPPPSAFPVRFRARTLSPAKPPRHHQLQRFGTTAGTPSPTTTSPTPANALLLHAHVARLEAELAATNARLAVTDAQLAATNEQLGDSMGQMRAMRAQMEQMTDLARTMMDVVRKSEVRERVLLERVERLEIEAASPSASTRRRVESPSPVGAIEGTKTPPTLADARSAIETSPVHAAPAAALALANSLSAQQHGRFSPPPAFLPGRRLRRSRTLPSDIFSDYCLGGHKNVVDVGVIRRASGARAPRERAPTAMSDQAGYSSNVVRAQHGRSAIVRRKSIPRSTVAQWKSSSGRVPLRVSTSPTTMEQQRARAHTTKTTRPSTPSSLESEKSTLLSPTSTIRAVVSAEAAVEAGLDLGLDRKRTLSLFTSPTAAPRKKRSLPLSGAPPSPNPPSTPSPSSVLPPSAIVSASIAGAVAAVAAGSVSGTKKMRPTLHLQRTASEPVTATMASTVAPTAPLPSPPPPPVPEKEPLLLKVQQLRASAMMARPDTATSSILATDDHEAQAAGSSWPMTPSQSSHSQTLNIPPSVTNSRSNSPSVSTTHGPSSPSFEQLVELLEDLAARTPNATASGAGFESEGLPRSPLVAEPSAVEEPSA